MVVMSFIVAQTRYSEDVHPIQIKFDIHGFNADQTAQLTRRLFVVKKLLGKMLKVGGGAFINPFETTQCEWHLKVPERYHNRPTHADLLVFVRPSRSNETAGIAGAIACEVDDATGRPIIGRMAISQAYFMWPHYRLRTQIQTLLHEMMHILVFSKQLFVHFQTQPVIYKTTKETQSSRNQTKYIVTPLVKQFVQEHFNCSTAIGAPLENEGTKEMRNRHWETIAFGDELMSASHTQNLRLTNLTLSLLADSGWYKVDFSFGEAMHWGRHKGCDFLESGCLNTHDKLRYPTEFCPAEGVKGCTSDFMAKANCGYTGITDRCPVYSHIPEGLCTQRSPHDFDVDSEHEEIGDHTRCLEIKEDKKHSSGCFHVECYQGKVMQVQVGGKPNICMYSGQRIKYKGLTIYCPDPKHFCRIYHQTSHNCSGRGYRFKNQCFCYDGWEGDSCDKRIIKAPKGPVNDPLDDL